MYISTSTTSQSQQHSTCHYYMHGQLGMLRSLTSLTSKRYITSSTSSITQKTLPGWMNPPKAKDVLRFDIGYRFSLQSSGFIHRISNTGFQGPHSEERHKYLMRAYNLKAIGLRRTRDALTLLSLKLKFKSFKVNTLGFFQGVRDVSSTNYSEVNISLEPTDAIASMYTRLRQAFEQFPPQQLYSNGRKCFSFHLSPTFRVPLHQCSDPEEAGIFRRRLQRRVSFQSRGLSKEANREIVEGSSGNVPNNSPKLSMKLAI